MEKAVVVLVGDWELSDGGTWDFIVEKNCMAQCILVDDDITYKGLRRLIEREFAGEVEGFVGRIAYWLPSELSIFSKGLSPPVSITSDLGLRTFMKVRQGTKGLNLFVTFTADRGTQGEEGASGARFDVSACVAQGQSIRLDEETPSLHNDGEEREVRIIGESSRGQKQGPVNGIHNVSSTSSRENEMNSVWDSEMVAEVERVEAMTEHVESSRHRKGKEKVPDDSNWHQSPSISDEYDSDESCQYVTREEAEYNYAYWNGRGSGENAGPYGAGQNDQGEPSQMMLMDSVPETQEAIMGNKRKGKEHMVEEQQERATVGYLQGADNNEGHTEEDDIAMQQRLTNIHNAVLESDIFTTEDCPPCFGDECFESEENCYGEFDARKDAIYIGKVFTNKQEMRTALAVYAVKRCFNFRQVKSDKERLIVACVDRKCPWRVYGHVLGGSSRNLSIRTATLRHTCDVATRSGYGQKATAKVIAQVLKSKYANGKIGPRAIDIPAIVLDELRVSVSYMRAWHAKEVAVAAARGSGEQSYKLLKGYLRRLKEKNEGTVTVLETTGATEWKMKFKYLFFALGASIQGLPHMRKVIIIDGTQIKGKFKGCLLTASCQDGNFCIFPIGFGVVNSENEAAWAWFFVQLKSIIPDSEDLVFVSDRHAAIYKSLRDVYPKAAHGACAVHLYRNVLARFNRATGVPYLFTQVATAYTVQEFTSLFQEIEARSPTCAKYLRGIGISHWARAYFQGKRYNVTNTNIAESLNAAVAKALEFPIVTMVESVRLMLMRWFYERRVESSAHQGRITPEVEKKLLKNLEASAGLLVAPAATTIFQVSTPDGTHYTVDLARRSCSCKQFDTLGYPCAHGMAAARQSGTPIHMLVSDFYKTDLWRNAYTAIVMPVPDEPEPEVGAEEGNSDLLPPQTSQPPGRPRKRRIPSIGELSGHKRVRCGPKRCSRCLGTGHNRASCKNSIP